MSQLNARTRAVLKTAVNMYLNQTCMITVDSISTDSYGAETHTTQVAAASVSCRLIRATPSDAAIVGNQETMADTYRLIVREGTALAVDQRVTVDNITYNVIGLVTGLTDNLYESAIVRRYR